MQPREPSQINQLQHYHPSCSKCGGPTALTRIEPAEESDHDLRTVECSGCGHAEVVKVRFR